MLELLINKYFITLTHTPMRGCVVCVRARAYAYVEYMYINVT
jgi:hypothetical protein